MINDLAQPWKDSPQWLFNWCALPLPVTPTPPTGLNGTLPRSTRTLRRSRRTWRRRSEAIAVSSAPHGERYLSLMAMRGMCDDSFEMAIRDLCLAMNADQRHHLEEPAVGE
jgi:hypothetical protein